MRQETSLECANKLRCYNLFMSKEDIKSDLTQIKNFFNSDGHGCFFSSIFLDLSLQLKINAVTNKQENEITICNNLNYILADLNNLLTLIHRLEWQHNLYCSGSLESGLWGSYAPLDIDHFHIQIQSILDYTAVIIKELDYPFPKAALGDRPSFGKLRGWVGKNSDRSYPDCEKLLSLIKSCSWFPNYNDVRNKTTHSGADTLAFYETKTIIFQNHSGMKSNIFDENLMFRETKPDGNIVINQNVVNFKHYAPLAIARIFLVLEEFAEIIRADLNIPNIEMKNARSYNIGNQTFLNWCDDFIETLSNQTN